MNKYVSDKHVNNNVRSHTLKSVRVHFLFFGLIVFLLKSQIWMDEEVMLFVLVKQFLVDG